MGDVWFPAPTSAWAALEGPLSDWGWEETPFLWMLEPVLACCVASGSLVSLSEAPWQAILYCVLSRRLFSCLKRQWSKLGVRPHPDDRPWVCENLTVSLVCVYNPPCPVP